MPGLPKNSNRKAVPRPLYFWSGIACLLIPGLIHAYLLMPFPGSQNLEAITICYYLEKLILPLRLIGAVLLIVYAFNFAAESRKTKIGRVIIILLCIGSYYFTDVAYSAQAMFKEPEAPVFADGLHNKVPQDYAVIGVVHNGVAKAYPIIYLGYHHKVQDNVGSLPVLVTYCTMCRTGRVFSPVVNGKRETFRLVGARHYNAVIEDKTTKSWWYQATGEAVTGKNKGNKLKELPYQQVTLAAWLQQYPNSLILQPENKFAGEYADLKDYDVKQAVDRDSTITNKDSLGRKSWIVGIIINGQAKAYDWRTLVKSRLFNDVVKDVPLLITLQKDKQSFHVWNRKVKDTALTFKKLNDDQFTDIESGSVWDYNGRCLDGKYKGEKLTAIQAYQEYWHSWKNFHPNSTYIASF